MNRKSKNIISILIMILIIGLMGLTIYFAKSNNGNMMQNNQMGNPPEMSNNNSDNGNMQDPPEKPDGESDSSTQEPPEMPSGNNNSNGMPQDMMNNQSTSTIYYILFGLESLILSVIIMFLILSKFNKKTLKETFESSDKVTIGILSSLLLTGLLTFGLSYITNNISSNKDNNQNNQINNNSNITYSASTKITESTTISGKSFESTTKDENALLVTGDIDVTADNITVNKTGDSDGGDNTSFYGTNSAILAKDGAILTIKNSKITTNATGANGVFSYGGSATTSSAKGDGTTINISDTTITTKKDNSGGIMTTGGGITNATNLKITTSGTSSAAIRTDRGGGTVTVNKGTYKTTGKGSPSIYSTANITVKNAKLESTASEGIVIEGKNSVSIEDTELTDTNNELNGQSTTYKNIFLYQSMSGDADEGISEFTAKNSSITTNKGDTFYITNTTSKITLTNNKIVNNDSTGNFLRSQTDSWGTKGSNGGEVTLVMNNQTVEGNIVIDSVSTLDMTMNNSTYKGKINTKKEAKKITLKLDKSSKITLTGNSYLTSLDNEDESNSNIDFNGYKLYVNGKAIN